MDKDDNPAHSPVLYEHTIRPQWGRAVIAWERDDKRGYQFEDGELRVISADYYKLLRPVVDASAAVAAALDRSLARTERVRSEGGPRLIPFELQIALFERDFPNGFRGDKWRKRMRGNGARSVLKRHRDPAIACAQQALAPAALSVLAANHEYQAIVDLMIDVLRSSDLVPSAQIKPLESMPPARAQALAIALQNLLHGDSDIDTRFDRYVAALAGAIGKVPSWRLATAIGALYEPRDELCVRMTVVRQQAIWLAPRLELSKRPRGATYRQLRDMATRVVHELRESGRRPADMLDVHDFLWHTLRPTARKDIAALRAQQAASGARADQPAQA